MSLNEELLQLAQDGITLKVVVGLHWTVVLAEVEGIQRCGLASTLEVIHEHHGEADVPDAGSLTDLPARDLAAWSIKLSGPIQRSIGMAALNALLPFPEGAPWMEANAEKVIAAHAVGKHVAIIGDFPFVTRLRPHVGKITVIDRRPHEGALPEEAAEEILPGADFIAITGMTVINRSLEGLLSLCPEEAKVMVLGPSTPMTPLMFDYGVDFLSGAVVLDHQSVLRTVAQGANFRQVHKAGVQLVTLERDLGTM